MVGFVHFSIFSFRQRNITISCWITLYCLYQIPCSANQSTWIYMNSIPTQNNRICKSFISLSFSLDGTQFQLEHGGKYACGIPDGDSIVLTGGFMHNHVIRCVYKLWNVSNKDIFSDITHSLCLSLRIVEKQRPGRSCADARTASTKNFGLF